MSRGVFQTSVARATIPDLTHGEIHPTATLDVWVLAAVLTAALIVAVYFGISILGKIGKISSPVADNEKTSTQALVDAGFIRLAGIVGALTEATLSWSFKLPLPPDDIWIKRFTELRDSAHPIWTDDRVRRLRMEFLHYCGLVGKPLGDAHETMDDRKKLDRFGRQLASLFLAKFRRRDQGHC